MMSEERRRFFRIDDTIEISYRLIDKEEANAYILQAKQGGNFDLAANFDNRIETLLDTCRIQSPHVAELVDLINKKLNFIIQHVDVDSELIHKIAYTLKSVNISACGMAFDSEEKFESGQILQLDIQLYPTELHIAALAEVVDCEPKISEDNALPELSDSFFVRLDFREMNNHDQELLIQHIVKRQSMLLKQRRHEST